MKRGHNSPHHDSMVLLDPIHDSAPDSSERMVSNLDDLCISVRSKTPSLMESSDSGSSVASSQMITSQENQLVFEKEELRVLIYTACYNIIDGVTLTIRKLEHEILAEGGKVCILSTSSGNPSNTNLVPCHPNRTVHFLDNSVDIFFFENAKDPNLSYRLGFHLSPNQRQQIDAFNPTVVHISSLDVTASHLITYARDMQVPLMGSYHSNIPEYFLFLPGLHWMKPTLERIFRHFYNFFQALYVPTPYIQRTLIEEQKMDRITDVKIWGRGVDLDRFTPTNRTHHFRRTHNIPDSCPVILFVGRLVPEKRIDIFAAVVRRLNSENVNFRAVVVGAGVSDYHVRSLKNTINLGWLDGDRLTEAYASSDIFLFPSSVETFGNVTLEAAASGLPLVVESKCSGHLVKAGVNGYACEAGNVDSFYEGTIKLILDDHMREAYSKASTALSETMEQSTIVRQMIQNYRDISNSFHDEYDGLHQNRDVKYRNRDSFLLGMEPRPFGFGCVSHIFIRGLQVTGNLLKFFVFCKERILSRLRCGWSCDHTGRVTGKDDGMETSLATILEGEEDDIHLREAGLLVSKSDTPKDEVNEEENGSRGFCCKWTVRCLDSRWAIKTCLYMLVFLSQFFRCMSWLRGRCTLPFTCECRKKYFCTGAKKRKS